MSLRTLIPPKIASAEAISGSASAKRMNQLVAFYRRLPKGPAGSTKPPIYNPVGRWYYKHFRRGNESITPIIQIIVVLCAAGYGMHYSQHLKHAKHEEGEH